MDAASEHPCLQPSDSLPKLVEEGESPPCLRVSPMPLAFLFIFLMYCLFPCIKGDLPLTLWANLLATDEFSLNTNCVIRGTFFPHSCEPPTSPPCSRTWRFLGGNGTETPCARHSQPLGSASTPQPRDSQATSPLPSWSLCPNQTVQFLHPGED